MVNYGGDEISALVLDIGSSSLRAGYAGDDTPKAIIPTSYGFIDQPQDEDIPMSEVPEATPKYQKFHLGHSGPSVWRKGMNVGNPMNEGMVHHFGPVTSLIKYAFNDVMRCDPSEHPVLVTEPAWNTVENRTRMAEIMFEEFNVPAFYIANTGVLNAFASGRGSALVIDVGQNIASVTPVVDGFVLRKGLTFSELPRFVHLSARHHLISPNSHRRGIELWPHQLVSNKIPTEPGAPPQFNLRQDRLADTTETWRAWAEGREVEEWMQSVVGVLEHGWNDQAVAAKVAKPYEFPTGFNTFFSGPERFSVGENYFYHNPGMVASNPNIPKNMPALISEALRACDPDLRSVLMGNVVLTGGGSLLAGFGDRLHSELTRTFPHVKIHAPGNPVERRYGGWLGGSILASLGTFHQLWISKEEWQEHGKSIVAQRCK